MGGDDGPGTERPTDGRRLPRGRAGRAVSSSGQCPTPASPEGPERFQDGQYVTLAGIVASSRTRTTKNGRLMCYIQFEDDSGAMSCWPSRGPWTRAAAI